MPSTQPSPSGSASSWSSSSAFKALPSADLELRDIVLILRRRKVIIFLTCALGIILAIIWVILTQKEYSSTATIEINKENSNSLGLEDLSGIASGLGGGDELTTDLMTQQAVITSDNTALNVVQQLRLDAEPPYAIPPSKNGQKGPLDQERGLPLEKAPLQRERVLAIFRSRLSVKLVKGTRLLSVTYTDTNPIRSATIANAVVNAYIDEYTQARYDASSKASSWLANQLADLKAKVEESQAKVTEYERQSGLTGLTMSAGAERRDGTALPTTSSDNVPLERLLELNRDLTNAEVSKIAKEAIYRMVQTQDPDVVLGVGSSPLASSLGSDSVLSPGSPDLTLLQQLRQQKAQLDVQLAAAESKYGAKNPAIIQLRNEESSLSAQISAELTRIRTRAKNDLNMAALAEDGIRQRVTSQEQEVNKVSAKADQLLLLQEEALSNRALYQDLYTKLEEASVAAGIRASNITLVNPARSPTRPSSPKKLTSIGLGGTFGLLGGLIAAFLWDYFDDSITSPEQIRQLTTTPVIGIIPDFEQKQNAIGRYGLTPKTQQVQESGSLAWLLKAPRSHISEAYRTFRTALLMSRAEEPPRMMLVMSGSPKEGKSTTCFNTAVSFAVQGDKVLYVDADLRRAQAHIFFNCSNDVGLSNCLTSGLNYRDVLKPCPGVEKLSLLPAGPPPPNPSELIGSKRFASLLSELRNDFDYVFIDSPPVLLVTDAQLISSLVDGYVLVARSNRTTKRLLKRSLELMHTPKASALGIVVNAMDVRSADYSGYGYYAGGGGYYVEDSK